MPETINFSLLAGFILSIALIASALLGWLGDLKRVGAATSARETTRRSRKASARSTGPRAGSPRPAPASGARATSADASAQQARRASEQEDRIRDAYFAKERKAREFRERQRRQSRQQQARQRTRSGPSSRASGGGTHAAPPSASTQEAAYRLTLGLKGPATRESVRIAYRRLIAAYHPDRCATLGIKLQQLAEEETKRINEAYSYFRRQLK